MQIASTVACAQWQTKLIQSKSNIEVEYTNVPIVAQVIADAAAAPVRGTSQISCAVPARVCAYAREGPMALEARP